MQNIIYLRDCFKLKRLFDITWDNGKKYEGVYCAEKFEILSSKTKGLYDILVDDLFLFKWDGKDYTMSK